MVERFTHWCSASHGHNLMRDDVHGNLVLASDYDRSQARIAQLEAALRWYAKARVNNPTPGAPFSNCDDGMYARQVLGSALETKADAPFGVCENCGEPITSFHNINGCPASKPEQA